MAKQKEAVRSEVKIIQVFKEEKPDKRGEQYIEKMAKAISKKEKVKFV